MILLILYSSEHAFLVISFDNDDDDVGSILLRLLIRLIYCTTLLSTKGSLCSFIKVCKGTSNRKNKDPSTSPAREKVLCTLHTPQSLLPIDRTVSGLRFFHDEKPTLPQQAWLVLRATTSDGFSHPRIDGSNRVSSGWIPRFSLAPSDPKRTNKPRRHRRIDARNAAGRALRPRSTGSGMGGIQASRVRGIPRPPKPAGGSGRSFGNPERRRGRRHVRPSGGQEGPLR
mmetsp:Transcript_9242/g.19389  ORF Transcript_9242/g.19389 Transcript_9242/m.19389 type:complete len:228 (+) Transcript_9242:81-764(+)